MWRRRAAFSIVFALLNVHSLLWEWWKKNTIKVLLVCNFQYFSALVTLLHLVTLFWKYPPSTLTRLSHLLAVVASKVSKVDRQRNRYSSYLYFRYAFLFCIILRASKVDINFNSQWSSEYYYNNSFKLQKRSNTCWMSASKVADSSLQVQSQYNYIAITYTQMMK